MTILKINDFLPNAFSSEQAEQLREKINNVISDDKIVLDFAGIAKFTALFFNLSTGYFMSLLGKEAYDAKFDIRNLNKLGESTYIHSYNNSVRDEVCGSDEMREKIMNIINGTDEA